MFDIYPRHGHRTPQQIAEDAGGSFEPRKTAGTPRPASTKNQSKKDASSASPDDGAIDNHPNEATPR